MRGTVLSQRYLVDDEIGRGAMGIVYRAVDLRTGGAVAVKLLPPDLTGDAAERAHLRQEARIAAALTSPHVVRVTDLDEHEGVLFLAMEYVPGETLHDRLVERGRLPVAEALAVALAICRALAEAHKLGIVHRDLKPRNVKVAEGVVKVLDFGIAVRSGQDSADQRTGFMGTPAYCAPEQARGGGDIRSDLYALGVMLFEMLQGERPFEASHPLTVIHDHATRPPPPLSTGIPDAVRRIVARCLEKQPSQRYQTPAELERDLLDALAARPVEPAWTAVPVPYSPRPSGGSGTVPNNLPAPVSSFVGRARERAEVAALLTSTRLLTLAGPGGAGKTRLAQQIAGEVARRFPAGVWLVELAALTDAALVALAVAHAVGAVEDTGQPAVDAAVAALGAATALIVLDNCEHVIEAAADIAVRLLRACPSVRILATSREPLAVAGEMVARPTPPGARSGRGCRAGGGHRRRARRVRRAAALRRARRRGIAHVPHHRRQSAARRAYLSRTRRAAARDRAGGGAAAYADPGTDRGWSGRPLPSAGAWTAHRLAPPADAARPDRLEL
ncbi:MAG: protein kinase [Dehalococcoidia bacterium]